VRVVVSPGPAYAPRHDFIMQLPGKDVGVIWETAVLHGTKLNLWVDQNQSRPR
jgi:hypothetical protein